MYTNVIYYSHYYHSVILLRVRSNKFHISYFHIIVSAANIFRDMSNVAFVMLLMLGSEICLFVVDVLTRLFSGFHTFWSLANRAARSGPE